MNGLPKIAVYGAGAMGTVLGTFLTACGFPCVHLISRNGAHIRALKTRGAKVRCVADGKTIEQAVTAFLPEEMTEKYDVVFLMTKQRENAKTVSFLKNFLTENAIVCTVQNGFPEPSVAEIVGADRVFGGVCTWGATFLGEGEVELTSKMSAMGMEIGAYGKNDEGLRLLRFVLERAGNVINESFLTVTDDLTGSRWSKLAINAAFSGLSVVTGLRFGEIAKRKKSRKLALELLRECFSVAKAAGITLQKVQGRDLEKLLGSHSLFGRAKAWVILPIAMKKHASLVSGMLKDVERGKKCEIDFIDGAVSRIGLKNGVETPYCDRVVEIVHGIENGLYEITYGNLDFFEDIPKK